MELQECLKKNPEFSLHEAAQTNHEEAVSEWIQYISSDEALIIHLNQYDDDGYAPLHYAAKFNHVSILCKLLDAGADPALPRRVPQEMLDGEDGKRGDDYINGDTPLHLACKYGNVEVVRALLQKLQQRRKEDICRDNEKEYTPLDEACKFGNFEIVAKIIEVIPPQSLFKTLTKRKETPLLIACAQDCPEIVKHILELPLLNEENCAELMNKSDSQGNTPMHYAAKAFGYDMVKFLLQKCSSASLSLQNQYGNTPLMVAAEEGNEEACNAFLDGGASLRDTDIHGRNVIHLAANKNSANLLKCLLNPNRPMLSNWSEEMFQAEFKHLVNVRDENGQTPLHLAAEKGSICVIDFLIRSHSNIYIKDNNGNTPFHIICGSGYYEAVVLLVKMKINLETRNNESETPLDMAACEGRDKVVKLLIESGADFKPVDDERTPPLMLAIEHDHLEVVEVLLQHGVDVKRQDPETKITPIEIAIKYKRESIAMAIMNSPLWRDALEYNISDTSTPFRELIKSMPSVACVALDKCTSFSFEEKMSKRVKDMKISLNFQFLEDVKVKICRKYRRAIEYEDVSWGIETGNPLNHPVLLMAKYNREELMGHPLVRTWLNYQWKGVLPFFLLNFFLYILYLIFITSFALTLPNPQSLTCQAILTGTFGRSNQFMYNVSNASECTVVNVRNMAENASSLLTSNEVCLSDNSKLTCQLSNEDCGFCQQDSLRRQFLRAAAAIVFVMAFMLFIIEVMQLSVMGIEYFKDWVNWVEMLMSICAVIFAAVFTSDCSCPRPWQWEIGSGALFLSWIDFLVYIRMISFIGVYINMFEKIIGSALKLLGLIIVLVIAFALPFYMIFDVPIPVFASSPFSSPGHSIVKVMDMATGELDYDDIFRLFPGGASEGDITTEVPFQAASFTLIILFFLLMPILLNNLITGVAIENVSEIQKGADVKNWQLKVEFVLSLRIFFRAFHPQLLTVYERKSPAVINQTYFMLFGLSYDLFDRDEIITRVFHSSQARVVNSETEMNDFKDNVLEHLMKIKERMANLEKQ